MVRLIGYVLGLLPTCAFALEAVNCRLTEYETPSRMLVECEVENDGATAIAVLRYNVAVFGEGRTVPWGRTESRKTDVPGGIDPAETATVLIYGPPLPVEADEPLKIKVEITAAFDVNGEIIRLPQP